MRLCVYTRITEIHTRILSGIISNRGNCRRTVWKLIDLFMVRVRGLGMPRRPSRGSSARVSPSYCYNPEYYPADAGCGWRRERGRESADRQRVVSATAATWPFGPFAEGVIRVDRSVNWIVSDNVFFLFNETVRIPQKSVRSAHAGPHIPKSTVKSTPGVRIGQPIREIVTTDNARFLLAIYTHALLVSPNVFVNRKKQGIYIFFLTATKELQSRDFHRARM